MLNKKTISILKKPYVLLLVEMLYMILIFIWLKEDVINFGIGLGALLFYYLSMVSAVFLFIIIIIIIIVLNRFKSKVWSIKVGWVIAVFFGLVSLAITFYCTLGRGPDCPWNGVVFNPCGR